MTNRSAASEGARPPAVLAEHAGQLADPGRHRVARLRDRHRQQRHEDGAEDGAVQAAEPAHHHHQQQLDREQHAEDVGRQEADLVGEERAAPAPISAAE